MLILSAMSRLLVHLVRTRKRYCCLGTLFMLIFGLCRDGGSGVGEGRASRHASQDNDADAHRSNQTSLALAGQSAV